MGAAQAQFVGSAEHAEGDDAANLALLDLEFLAENGANAGARDLLARVAIGGTTDDLQGGFLPHIDAAHAQRVRIGMGLAVENLRDHDGFRNVAGGLYAFHLEPGHGQAFGHLGRFPVNIDIVLKPFD